MARKLRGVLCWFVSILPENFVYSQELATISDINFKRMVLHTFDQKGKHLTCGQRHDGRWESIDEKDYVWEALTLRHAYVLPSRNSETQFVLVIFDYWVAAGSSDTATYAQIWKLESKQLRIVEQIDVNTHFDTPDSKYFFFDPDRQILWMLSSDFLPGDAVCCLSAYDELTIDWTGSQFELKKRATRLTDFGKEHGAKLPASVILGR